MAGSLNRATILGHLGKDPEIRTMNSGDKVANFSIATSERWTKNGEKVEKTHWHNIVVWGKLAEIVERYVKKGSKILIEGAIETREWEKDGVKRYSTEIILRGFDSKLILLGDKGERSDGGSSGYESASRSGGGTSQAPQLDDDGPIPF